MKKIGIVPFEKILSGNLLYDRELKRAPWEIEAENFARIDAPELIEKTLQVIENDHIMLVLTSTSGVRYSNTILTKFDRESCPSIVPPILTKSPSAVFAFTSKTSSGFGAFSRWRRLPHVSRPFAPPIR